jgi:NTP pyrophosphatase (non-canonical NTP hydrolase)
MRYVVAIDRGKERMEQMDTLHSFEDANRIARLWIAVAGVEYAEVRGWSDEPGAGWMIAATYTNSPLKNSAKEQIISEIFRERVRQDAKWGEQNHDDLVWLAILTKEVGELAQAILKGQGENVHRELVQTAAVCVNWLEMFRRAITDPTQGLEKEKAG